LKPLNPLLFLTPSGWLPGALPRRPWAARS